jgi:hypothetical protein
MGKKYCTIDQRVQYIIARFDPMKTIETATERS